MSDFLSELLALNDSEDSREGYIRAPFGYPGAKSRSLDFILPHLPYWNTYIEPFGGSGAVLLARNPSKLEVFNDKFSGVTSFYRVIRDNISMNKLLDRLQLCLHSREEFIWSRDTWKDCEDPIERAARWYYMVVTSFGSLGRNFGRSTRGKSQIPQKIKNNLKLFPELHLRLLNVQIENQDWRMMFKDYDNSQTVWYLDPPYYKTTLGQYECDMSSEEHLELLERIQHLEGFVALSGYSNPLYNNLKWKWDRILEWKSLKTSVPLANTETNYQKEKQERYSAIETLYIKNH